MALYTAAYGGIAGCFFFMLSLWSRKIGGPTGGWGRFLLPP
jgi:hypothetical protein